MITTPATRAAAAGEAQRIRDARATKCIRQRQRGVTVAAIAAADQVSRATITRATAAAGPYPRPGQPTRDQVTAWVADRRAGRSLAAIAAAAGTTSRKIAAATQPQGPYPRRSNRTPDGLYTRSDIASLLRVPAQTIHTWHRAGHLPPADFTTRTGRPIWLPGSIHAWLPTSGLHHCDLCGAWTRETTRPRPDRGAGDQRPSVSTPARTAATERIPHRGNSATARSATLRC